MKSALFVAASLALLVGLQPTPAQAQASRASMIRISCEGDSSRAQVTINGQFRGECPIDLQVDAGPVNIRAMLPVGNLKERVFEQSFTMGESSVKRIELVLGPEQFTAEGQKVENQRLAAQAKKDAEAAQRLAKVADAQARFEMFDVPRIAADKQRQKAERLSQAVAAAGINLDMRKPFRDCSDCPEMAWIPPGKIEFDYDVMPGVPQEMPPYLAQVYKRQHLPVTPGVRIGLFQAMKGLTLERPFAMGRFELTYEEYDRCAAEGACKPILEGVTKGTIFDTNWGRGRQPALLSVPRAREYLAWVSKRTGQSYRLPTVAEWVRAASGGVRSRFPWGDMPDPQKANLATAGHGQTKAVGSYVYNNFGLHDVLGNVAEWATFCHDVDPDRVMPFVAYGQSMPYCSTMPLGGSHRTYVDGVARIAPGTDITTLRAPAEDPMISIFSNGMRVLRELPMPADPAAEGLKTTVARDCTDCPEMVLVGAADFIMGKPVVDGKPGNQSPQRVVKLAPYALAKDLVTVGQWGQFLAESGYQMADEPCWQLKTVQVNANAAYGEWIKEGNLSWLRPGFTQTRDSPVTCINHGDALAFVKWYSAKTGRNYRLPSEAEWEFVAGTDPGPAEKPAECVAAPAKPEAQPAATQNADVRSAARLMALAALAGPSGGGGIPVPPAQAATAQSAANCKPAPTRAPLPINDAWGRLRQWTSDCYEPDLLDAPADGLARSQCREAGTMVLRGTPDPQRTISRSDRTGSRSTLRTTYNGLRLARDQ